MSICFTSYNYTKDLSLSSHTYINIKNDIPQNKNKTKKLSSRGGIHHFFWKGFSLGVWRGYVPFRQHMLIFFYVFSRSGLYYEHFTQLKQKTYILFPEISPSRAQPRPGPVKIPKNSKKPQKRLQTKFFFLTFLSCGLF